MPKSSIASRTPIAFSSARSAADPFAPGEQDALGELEQQRRGRQAGLAQRPAGRRRRIRDRGTGGRRRSR